MATRRADPDEARGAQAVAFKGERSMSGSGTDASEWRHAAERPPRRIPSIA
jgi:hypothetical protein